MVLITNCWINTCFIKMLKISLKYLSNFFKFLVLSDIKTRSKLKTLTIFGLTKFY